MAVIPNCELWFAKVDPKRPNNRFNKSNPTWEVQIRTYDKEVRKQWEAMKLPVKAIVPDDGETYFRVNLRKKSIKEDGEKASPIRVVDGDLNDVDPNSIGNASIGNVRIFQYDFSNTNDETGAVTKGVASVLMGIQLTKHIVYVPKPREDEFQQTTTETIAAPEVEDDEDASPSTKSSGVSTSVSDDDDF